MIRQLLKSLHSFFTALASRLSKKTRLIHALQTDLARAEEEIKTLQLNLIQLIRLKRKDAEKKAIKPNAALDRVHLASIVEDCLTHLRPFFESKKIKLTASTHAPNLRVLGHKHQLEEVLMCILMNAIDAVEKSQNSTIDVQIQQKDKYAVVSVKDSGAGIPAEDHDKVFSPFFTTKPLIASDRIGLSISKLIIQQYGGKISFTSKPGEGSVFHISLPHCEVDTTTPSLDKCSRPSASASDQS